MKTPKKRILYSNYYDSENEEAAIEYLIERHLERYPDDTDWKPDSDDIWNELNLMDEIFWDDFKMNFKDFFNENTFILQGNTGRWNGRFKTGFVFDSFEGMFKAWSDCDYVELYDENGHLYIQCSHHDGTNLYEIRKLTDKGYDYYSRHKWYDDDRKIHNTLMKSGYSVLPHCAHTVFGCKRIEFEKSLG